MLPLTQITRKPRVSIREAGDTLAQFSADLAKLLKAFDADYNRLPDAVQERFDALDHADKIDSIIKDIGDLGHVIQDECDAAEEASDCARANPLIPDFRMLDR